MTQYDDDILVENDEPLNYDEIVTSSDKVKWLEAIKSKMGSMYTNQV